MGHPFDNVTIRTKYGLLGATTVPIIVCGGAFLAWAYWRRWKAGRQTRRRPTLMRSMSMGVLHGGQLALRRLVDYNDARADAASLATAMMDLETLLAQECPNFIKIQSVAAKLEMTGKEADAVRILEKGLEKAQKRLQEAYEIEMLLVEMLIYKGDFDKASRCKCLDYELITDARRPFYKAIIHILLDHPSKEAENCWEEFKEIRKYFEWPPSLQDIQLYEVTMDFHKFKKFVKLLKNDIQKQLKKK